jgi:hypothetical protein
MKNPFNVLPLVAERRTFLEASIVSVYPELELESPPLCCGAPQTGVPHA